MAIGQELYCRTVGIVAGLLILIPNYFPEFAPLQFLGIGAVVYYAVTVNGRWKSMLVVGLYMGLFFTIPQLITLRMHMITSAILLVYFLVTMMVLCWGVGRCIRGSAVWGSFAVGAFLVLLDFVNMTAIPIWGAAQSMVRSWSSWPNLIMFTSVTGIAGVIFVMGLLVSLIVNYILRPETRKRVLITAVVVVLVVGVIDVLLICEKPVGSIKIAAVGWIYDDESQDDGPHSDEGFQEHYVQRVKAAADAGARLVVSGEMGFYFSDINRDEWHETFAKIACDNEVYLAIGYFDLGINKNQMLFMSPAGDILETYTKTYLTPFEPGLKGDGDLKIIEIDGVRVGGMICHDDNFTKMTRYYGRQGVAVLALPIADWTTIRQAHIQSSISRAIEGRYAIVRGAANGISAVISPKGEVLDSRDHYDDGPGFVISDVNIYSSHTFYSIAGEWLVIASGVFIGLKVVAGRMKTLHFRR